MEEPRVTCADQVDLDQLAQFLQRIFGASKSAFLQRHGAWRHRGHHNRLIFWIDDEIAAYSGLIPTTCLIQGRAEPAMWWVDLVVAPEYRGRRLTAHVYKELAMMDVLKVGFPNELAAKLHRKQQWGVRDDLQVLMLPLRPLGVKRVRRATGARGWTLKAGAAILTPLAGLWRQRLQRYRPVSAHVVAAPVPDVLASIFDRYQPRDTVTTYRDASYFQRRFLEAPYPVVYYLAGPASSPTHYLVARHVDDQGVKATRILDLFGDFEDVDTLHDIVLLALRDAGQAGSSQVTIMATLPVIQSRLRSLGFVVRTKARFCWNSTSSEAMQALGQLVYWTLADSDNDAVVGRRSR